MNNDFLLRIKDVTLCLLAANKNNILLSRLEIQKIIYLIDSMSAYLFVLSGQKGHQTYFYGPYDKNIQNALDALVLRDIAEMQDLNIHNKNISCNYILTGSGLAWANEMLNNSKSINYRSKIVEGVIYSLIQRDLLHKVKELVYAEPVYVEAKVHGNHYDLALSCDNSGHSYLALIEHYLKDNENQIDISFATDMYIDYLSTREQFFSSNSYAGGKSDAL
jgi:hypothetical protein